MLDTTGGTAMRFLPQGQLQFQLSGTLSRMAAVSFGSEIVISGCSMGFHCYFLQSQLQLMEVQFTCLNNLPCSIGWRGCSPSIEELD